ncbi:MAG: amidohydrolase [Spirochaetia bacterium]|nr:amidohydrolase [Spirochaetia bacterium]
MVREHKEELITLRRDFHAHPELGFEEFRTAKVIEEYIQSLGLSTERVAKTGVVALLSGTDPSGPVLLMRADIDALPVKEETGLPFLSTNGRMHACGHDAHMAMMLTALKILSKNRDLFKGTIKFVFQPNEEVAGAQVMIDEGVLENPKVDAAIGLHIWSPLPSGIIGIKSGAVTASMDVFKITINGRGGHTGYPDSAKDPIICASNVIIAAQSIQTRFINPMKPISLMFGIMNGGTKNNIIPDSVVLEGSLRYLYSTKPGNEDHPTTKFIELVNSVCATFGCTAQIDILHENDAVVNNSSMAMLAQEVAVSLVGKENVVEHATMAGEDFAAFGENVPAMFAFIGTANEKAKSTYPHHNPKFTIDEETLPLGVQYLVETAIAYFKRGT